MAARTSFTSSSKAARALAIAAVLVGGANAAVGARVGALIADSSLSDLVALERRVARFAAKPSVRVLVVGNSHAVAGLRPPLLARAMGLGPDTVFSLALPNASPFECLLLARRFLPSFPAAELALVGVDSYFLGVDTEVRLRYLTRGGLAARWEYARRFEAIDARVGLLAGLAFPIADFGLPLRRALTETPALTARRFTTDVDGEQGRKLEAIAYPWGYPPVWDAAQVPHADAPRFLKGRAAHMTSHADHVAQGLEDLETLAGAIEGRGLRVQLVQAPMSRPLAAMLAPEGKYAAYRSAIAAYTARSGRRLADAPSAMPSACFIDATHMSPLGAAMLASRLGTLGAGLKKVPA